MDSFLFAASSPAEAPASSVQERQWPWKAEDGSSFICHEWKPAGSSSKEGGAQAVVLAIHGLGGAGSDFGPLGESLCRQGIAVYAPDLRSQGNDPVVARRGNIRDLREIVRDLHAFARAVVERHPRAPLYLYGESMGAMLALHLAAGWSEAPSAGRLPAGLILASPVIAFDVPQGWWQQAWFKLFLGVAPGFRLPLRGLPKHHARGRTEPPRVTRDEAYTHYLRNSPHRLRHVTPRFLHSLLGMIQLCREIAPALRMPVLMLYAGHDIFVRPALAEAVFDQIGSADKTRCFFKESFHLLLHDHDCDDVLEAIRSWVAAHLP